MKAILALVVLAVIATVSDSSVIQDSSSKIASRANLNMGYISVGDRLLHRSFVFIQAIMNQTQYRDVVFQGNATDRITSIQAYEVGVSQRATAYPRAGGLGQNTVTVRFTTAMSLGYHYELLIWGR